MRHGASSLALTTLIALSAYACGRDEGRGSPSSPIEAGGAGGESTLGDGGVAAGAAGQMTAGGAGACEPTTLPEELAGPVRGLSLKQVSVLQGVTVPIMEQMLEIEPRSAQLISGRPGLVRVYVRPASDWRARAVRARLTIRYGEGEVSTQVHEQTLFVERVSEEGNPSSTFNLELPAEAFDASSEYSVELLETESCTEHEGDVEDARYPDSGTAPLRVVEGQSLRVRIVPIQMQVGDEVFLPDISPEQLELMRREVIKLFPVRDVELSVRESPLSSSASDMVSVYNEIASLREQENLDSGLSYYGLVQFGPDIVSYCSPSCVLGASTIGEAPGGGAAAGVGYSGSKAAVTFAHELGHVYGRPHSPCGVAGDSGFPYAGGGVGGWGYDVLEQKLVEPAGRRDFMGYCSPTWVSDHTYEHLRTFIAGVAATPAASRFANGSRARRHEAPVIRCGEP